VSFKDKFKGTKVEKESKRCRHRIRSVNLKKRFSSVCIAGCS